MKLEHLLHIICLSCILVFLCVSSQPGCSDGWFGQQCKYKCRCDNSSCDFSGSCIQPYTCKAGWFGPACQYADLAYQKGNVTELTDNNDLTCNVPNVGDRITIPFNEPNEFTWLRIHVTDQGSDALRNLTVTFSSNASSVTCPVWRKHAVNKTIIDMHCDLSQNITDMTLAGPAVPHLCSVYVSGGRNVAVKETAWQDSTYIENVGGVDHYMDADKAVDGDIHQNLNDLSCAHTRNTPTWTVTLSRQRSVRKYVLYNRSDVMKLRLKAFELESFDSMNRSVFKYKDAAPSPQLIYKITHSPLPVQMVVITAHNSEDIVTLCEVEIFGDSICDQHHYGRDCEHYCSCADNETCFLSTGVCPSGCPPGFFGDSCTGACPAGKLGNYCNLTCSDNCQPFQNRNTSGCDNNAVCQTQCKAGFIGPLCTAECSVGKFGINCTQSCSPNCAPSGQATVSSCNIVAGTCLKGCQSGFSGALCGDECGVGKFGMNCSASCSPKCAPPGQANVSSCDIKTGACLKGCQSGFSGDSCKENTPKAAVASASSPMNLILGLGALVALLFVAAFCISRKGKMRQAAEGPTTNVHPE